MLEDIIRKVSDTVSDYRGESISEETAQAVEDSLIAEVSKGSEDTHITLREYLKLYLPMFDFMGGKVEEQYLGFWATQPQARKIRVFINGRNYQPERRIPLTIHHPLLGSKNLEIKNLRRFLADYQQVTGTWIGAEDILAAEVKCMYLENDGKYADRLTLICELL